MKSWSTALAALFATAAATAAASQSPSLAPQPTTSPAAKNSAQPQLSVSKRGVLVRGIERTGDLATLKFAERTSSGWTLARTIASCRDWFVNWADMRSALRLPSGAIGAHWLQRSGPDTDAYDGRLSHSIDEGRTWSSSYLPHHDETKTEQGFASLFPMREGFGLVWLDGRTMLASPKADEGGTSGGEHGGEHGGGRLQVRTASARLP